MSEDIDGFIRQQKAKLTAERDNLDNVISPREDVSTAVWCILISDHLSLGPMHLGDGVVSNFAVRLTMRCIT